jgi:hypothetical protein
MPYPEHRHMLAWTTVRRMRMLPETAIGLTTVVRGKTVNLRDVVARGSVPSRYVFIDAMRLLRLRKPEELDALIIPDIGETVEEGQVLAGRSADRGRRVFAPVNGIFVYAGEGRIIIQETPGMISLESGLIGNVIEVVPNRGVVIEAYGALVQGVWGNGRQVIGALRREPDDGLDSIFEERIDQRFSGTVVLTRRSLKAISLSVIENQSLGGVIAPSMDPTLVEHAQGLSAAIILTEGFGDQPMNSRLYAMLEEFIDRQVSVDAVLPDRWEDRQRPELFINLPGRSGDRPPSPRIGRPLRIGDQVRLTRAPHAGSIGEITHLPKTPQLLDNGLKVPCAQIALVTGESVRVPLANLEILGK